MNVFNLLTGKPAASDLPLTDLPPAAREEAIDVLVRGQNLRVERIVSHGHASPPGFWYDQEQDEWVLLVSGAARIAFENEPVERTLGPGDYLHIPAHRRHRVTWTTPDGPTVWLAIHYDA